jgi:hypothetical protein
VTSTVAHLLTFWKPEDDVTTSASSDRLGRHGEAAVRPFQIGQRLVSAVAGIDIEHEKA